MPFLSSPSSLFRGRSLVLDGVLEPLRASAKQQHGTNGASTDPGRAFAVPWLKPDRRPRRGGSGFD